MGMLPRKPPRDARGYDEALADRVRAVLGPDPDVVEKKMFGGVAFMVTGHMACGITTEGLMVRVGPDAFEAALAEPGARPMDFTGRPLRGFVYVDRTGCGDDAGLAAWVGRGVAFAQSLPPK